MTTPTPRPEPEHPPGLPPEVVELLRADAALADHGHGPARAVPPQQARTGRPDFDRWAREAAERSRPHRQARDHERTARQQRIDELRAGRMADAALAVLAQRFGRFTATEPTDPGVRRWAIAVDAGQRLGLVIRGGVGRGKTHEAVAAYRWLLSQRRRPVPAVAVSVPALLDGLRPGRQPVETLDACEGARLLLLDDLAAERATDWTAEVLYRLIDARYARNLPTIVTTNATAAMIREGLGDRIASRLNGLGHIVALDGPDRRDPRLRQQ